MIKFLDLQSQYLSIKPQIDTAIESVIRDTAFINGPYAKTFEQEFASYCGAAFCIGVANGTDALEIAIEALRLPQGSEIIVPANSFISSSEAVTRCGHHVVFADVDQGSYTLTADTVKAKLTPRTAAIVAVHLYGHPCDIDALRELANQHHLKIIEDCAQAHGAEYKGRRAGVLGDIAAFSFYPGKNLGAYGDAGAVTTNDEALANLSRKIANHGRIAKYDHDFEGRNSRLDGMQAAILSVKLSHLDEWTARRIQIADFYLEQLANVDGLTLPVRKSWAKQVYHLFVIRTARRDALAQYLKENNIETGIHYPKALPKLAAYDYLKQDTEDMFACQSDTTLLSLPIGEHMSLNDAKKIVGFILQFFG